MNNNLRLLFWIIALGLIACKAREIEDFTVDTTDQQRYFPLNIGQSIDYELDSIQFDFGVNVTVIDSNTTLVREIVADTLRDNLGRLQYKIERYERKTESDPWVIARIWSAERTNDQAIRTEENLRYLRMVFPMTKRSEWNGNLWIDTEHEILIKEERMTPFKNWTYEVDSIDIPRQIGVFSFDSTLVITEVDESNIIEKRYSYNVYAKNIGLVYKEQWILDSQYCNQSPPPVDCEQKSWVEKAEKGYILRQKVIGF